MPRNQIWGQTTVRVDGERFTTAGDSSLDVGGKMRDAVEADNEAGFFTEKTKESRCEFNILVNEDVSLAVINGWDDIVLNFEADTGQTYVITNGYVAETVSISDGKAKLIVQGPPAQEIR